MLGPAVGECGRWLCIISGLLQAVNLLQTAAQAMLNLKENSEESSESSGSEMTMACTVVSKIGVEVQAIAKASTPRLQPHAESSKTPFRFRMPLRRRNSELDISPWNGVGFYASTASFALVRAHVQFAAVRLTKRSGCLCHRPPDDWEVRLHFWLCPTAINIVALPDCSFSLNQTADDHLRSRGEAVPGRIFHFYCFPLDACPQTKASTIPQWGGQRRSC